MFAKQTKGHVFTHYHLPATSPSRPITPNPQHTHRKPHPTNTTPHKLNPLLLPRPPLNLLPINIIHILIHNSPLQARLHSQIQTAARSGYKTSPEQVRVSDASGTESERGEQRDAGEC
jgi:hypothetical protein